MWELEIWGEKLSLGILNPDLLGPENKCWRLTAYIWQTYISTPDDVENIC